ncbi:lactonase family protein [Adhaeribacter aquaticus]|uniref:lactonase family protein n=1 Tax=Adhaeribacter aquaticus TaxID=299567 RepID=UPI0003F7A23B|nr:lactonase family protein [Adhaeribacter aquaticus]
MTAKNHSRRQFIKSASLGAALLPFMSPLSSLANSIYKGNEVMFYVGTYAKPDAESIFLYSLNTETGAINRVAAFKAGENPSYLTLDSKRRFLYAVHETGNYEGQKSGAVSAFSIDQKNGNLILLNTQASLGASPCYISLDKGDKNALIANYSGGNVAVLPIQANGQLSPSSSMDQHEGSSVNTRRQKEAHAHSIMLDAANKYAFSADLGTDSIYRYLYDAKNGKITATNPPAVKVTPGAGPRHMAFHPNGKLFYLINELDGTVKAFAYTAQNGDLKELQTISTLPADFSGQSSCADLHVSPNGKFLYGSNRGHNSIVVYAIDAKTGKLTLVQHVSTEGKTPRNFTIDPSGKILLVANQDSNNIISFKINQQSGKLTPTGNQAEVPSPVCLQITTPFA